MPQLVILLPARPREGAAAAPAAPNADTAYAWALSPDGLVVARQGRSAPGLMPEADSVVAVVPATDLAWHRPQLPKAPAARLRAALGGLLEDQLLDDDEAVHLAVAPGAAAGAPCWVAALNKPWLQAHLAALAAGGRAVDRVVPAVAPALAAAPAAPSTAPGATAEAAGPSLRAHVFVADAGDGHDGPGGAGPSAAWLACAEPERVLCLPLAGSLATTWLQRSLERAEGRSLQLSATPAAATLAERALAQAVGGGAPAVAVLSDAEQALSALRSGWQLLQFDLAPQHRGLRAAGQLLTLWRSPAWRPARLGLGVLLVVQLLGLNAWAWQQRAALAGQRSAAEGLLRSAHPQVRAILDAPAQMQRETELLRERAGVAGDADLETLLAATAAAWPDGAAPATQLRFEPGRLSLAPAGWAPPQVEQFRQRLQAGGWALQQVDGKLVVQRGTAVAAPVTATTPSTAPQAPGETR